jgi:deoxyuridine 5'-triphosphate nucleotidohydrolase
MSAFIHYKLLTETAQVPRKSNLSDAGHDLYADEDAWVFAKQRQVIKTGISLAMPNSLAGLIWPRSGLSVKQGIDVLAGVVDAGYRGEVMVCLYNTSDDDVEIKRGDRIAQMIFQEVPVVSLLLREELATSQRGGNGFGSTGK